jgi:hypothetical protein
MSGQVDTKQNDDYWEIRQCDFVRHSERSWNLIRDEVDDSLSSFREWKRVSNYSQSEQSQERKHRWFSLPMKWLAMLIRTICQLTLNWSLQQFNQINLTSVKCRKLQGFVRCQRVAIRHAFWRELVLLGGRWDGTRGRQGIDHEKIRLTFVRITARFDRSDAISKGRKLLASSFQYVGCRRENFERRVSDLVFFSWKSSALRRFHDHVQCAERLKQKSSRVVSEIRRILLSHTDNLQCDTSKVVASFVS